MCNFRKSEFAGKKYARLALNTIGSLLAENELSSLEKQREGKERKRKKYFSHLILKIIIFGEI